MANLMGDKKASFLRLVEERALSKEEKKKLQDALVPYIPKDCISNVLLRLPLESLQRSRFVCKPWYTIINSLKFIDDHLERSESVLIFISSIKEENLYPFSTRPIAVEKPNTFSVEAKLLQSESVPVLVQPNINPTLKYYIKFLEINNGRSKIGEYSVSCTGHIRAACNGLILLENKLKKGGLIVVNPVTRKLISLPLGTLCPADKESYGFAFCTVTGEYKVVHLFQDELRYFGCEILNLGTRVWRAVNGPSFGLLRWLGCLPVLAIGALHWVPNIDSSDYLVSIEVDKERFHTIPLPKSSRYHDRIVEMRGFLSFVTHEEENQIGVWILKGLGELWTRQLSIKTGCILDMVPLYSLRIKGDMIFKRDEDGSFYAYDFQLQVMRKIEMEQERLKMSGELNEHEKIVSVLREVDIVISTLAYPQVLDQLKIIDAIKDVGNIKSFLPSDFGCEEDRVTPLPLFQYFLDKKKKIRRVIEEIGIPYRIVSANCFGAYFVNILLRPHEKQDDIVVYGSGKAKAVLNYEEDVALYTIKVANDPRTCNHIVINRPFKNIVSQLELISLWEKKTSRSFNRVYVPEEGLVRLSKTTPAPNNIPVSILHSIFVKGELMNFELGEDDIEASRLYPDLEYTTIDQLLDICLVNPPKPTIAATE